MKCAGTHKKSPSPCLYVTCREKKKHNGGLLVGGKSTRVARFEPILDLNQNKGSYEVESRMGWSLVTLVAKGFIE
jgi:hypothetical protein